MGLSGRFILERIEDPERMVVDAEAIPDSRAGLLFDDRLTALDEDLDLRFLAGFGLYQCQDPEGQCHVAPPVQIVRCSGRSVDGIDFGAGMHTTHR